MSARDQFQEMVNLRNREVERVDPQHPPNQRLLPLPPGNMENRPNPPNAGQNQDISVVAVAGPSGASSSGFPTSPSNPAKRRCAGYGPKNVDTIVSTEVEMEELSFLWTLKNFSALNGLKDIYSPVFRGGPKGNHSWQLRIYPKKKLEEQEYFSIYLVLAAFGENKTSPDRKLKVRFQISLLDPESKPGKQAGCSTMPSTEFKKGSQWGYEKLLLSSELVDPARRLVVGDALQIHCKLWIEGELNQEVQNGATLRRTVWKKETRSKRQKELASDLGKVLQNSVMTDVVITTPQNVHMAHKAVLAARSSVFAAMLSANSLDSVEITDFDDEVVKGMLQYLYTGETALLTSRATELLSISEKFGMSDLKEESEHVIAQRLSIENAAELLVMACICNTGYLKPRVVDFINLNKEKIKTTRSFQRMAREHPQVFVDLYLAE